jgi:hypothetical protein
MMRLQCVSAGVKATHFFEVKLTHPGNDGDFLAAGDVDPFPILLECMENARKHGYLPAGHIEPSSRQRFNR